MGMLEWILPRALYKLEPPLPELHVCGAAPATLIFLTKFVSKLLSD